ncbi:hypothetical protein CXB51_032072 [Gossypium anomalum]|uniref:Aminotransferase-like plant mobile domain-containing protein n=1 Tax=Gossypium anomalum TaxID=47600 RepID=A0A8J5XU14_9ROSI|nr:hypothetical protein CXB51_032072 [Gossypium anomalum]
MHLQLGLPVDGYAVTRSASSTDWGAVCYELLGAIPDNINRGPIEMGWLRDTFPELDNDSTELERIRYARAYILEMIRCYLMPNFNIVQRNVRGDATEQSQNGRLPITTAIMGMVSLSIFTSSSRPPIYISTHKEFQWTPYEDRAIRAVIPDEFLQNPNAWHVKVALVNYATVEMHRSDRVLRQFRFRQPIPMALEVFDDEHKVDLR